MSHDQAERDSAFQTVFENAGVGLGLAAPTGHFVAANGALCQLLGYPREELLTKTYLDITYEEDLAADRDLAQRYISGEISIFSIEKRYVRKDGSPIWVRVTVSAVRDIEGLEKYSVAIIEDIESRKRIEQELAETNAELERRVEERTSELQAANIQLAQDKTVLRHAFEAQDKDRRLTAYELHDGPAQDVSAALWMLEAIVDRQPLPPEEQENFDRATEMLRNSVAEVRRVISGLRPPMIDEQGLVPALTHLAYECSEVEVNLDYQLGEARLPAEVENAVFRIIQESVANIRRHSGSDRAQIRVVRNDRHIDLSIQDWGNGFDPDSIDPSRFGLRGIQERARVLGGNASISSQPGQGTLVSASFPVAVD